MIGFSSYNNIVLNEVYVNGRNNETKANIIAALDINIGHPLINISLKKIRKELIKLDWVEHADVYLLPMGKLEIELTEYIPFAIYIHRKDNYTLINNAGINFKEISVNEFPNLFKLYGNDALEKVEELSSIIDKLKVFNLNVSKIERIDSRRWDIYLKQGYVIKLPNLDVVKSIDAIHKLDNNIDYDNLLFIDLRIKDRVSLKYKQIE